MSNAARSFGRTTLVAFAVLAPAMLLAGCGSSTEAQIAHQVAIAQEAADRAEAAQKAAESSAKLAMSLTSDDGFGEEDKTAEEADASDGDEPDETTESTSAADASSDSGNSSAPAPTTPPQQ